MTDETAASEIAARAGRPRPATTPSPTMTSVDTRSRVISSRRRSRRSATTPPKLDSSSDGTKRPIVVAAAQPADWVASHTYT